jgi:hypothetical protein
MGTRKKRFDKGVSGEAFQEKRFKRTASAPFEVRSMNRSAFGLETHLLKRFF